MKKLKLFAAMAAAVFMAAGAAIPTQAASGRIVTQLNGKNCLIRVIYNPNCSLSGFPDADVPETGTPDADVPETDAPETGTPDADIPETDVPGTETPDADVPETDTPEEDSSYAAQVVRLVNEERAKVGLAALTVDTGLEAAGNVRAKEIAADFSHTRPNGTNFATAIQEQGVTYRGAGENIAWGQRSPEEVVNAWMNSSGHRANILNANYTRIGVGHYANDAGTNYWVQLFAY